MQYTRLYSCKWGRVSVFSWYSFSMRILLIFLAIFLFPQQGHAMSPYQAARICERIEKRAALQDRKNAIYERIFRRTGYECETSNAPAEDVTSHLFPELETFIASSNNSPLPYATLEEFGRALSAFKEFHSRKKSAVYETFISSTLTFFTNKDQFPYTVAYKNFFADFLGTVFADRNTNIDIAFKRFLHTHHASLQERFPEEFERQQDVLFHLWKNYGLLVVYWPDSYPQNKKDFINQISLLEEILETAKIRIPPQQNLVHLLILREYIASTANIGTIWLNPRAGVRTFAHELGHVLEFSLPEEQFAMFQALHLESRYPEDFASAYHPDASEDFAEVFAGLTQPTTHIPYVLPEALRYAEEGNVLLLEKLLFTLEAISPNAQKIPTFSSSQEISLQEDLPLYLQRSKEGRIDFLTWNTETWRMIYDHRNRLQGVMKQ